MRPSFFALCGLALVGCSRRGDLNGQWAGQCTLTLDYGYSYSYSSSSSSYSYGPYGFSYLLDLVVDLENEGEDISGSGRFDLKIAGLPSYGGDTGYYGGSYGSYGDTGYYGTQGYKGPIDGTVKGNDVELNLRFQQLVLVMEGEIDKGDTIAGRCELRPDRRGGGLFSSGGYSYSSSYSFAGDFELDPS